MSAIDRLLQLRLTAPFDRLRTEELSVIAEIVREATWRPGEVIASPDEPLRHLLIVRQGGVTLNGQTLPPVIGAAALLFDRPLSGALITDPVQGAAGLTIARGHLFTIVNECPGLLVTFYETAGTLVSTQP